MQNTVIKKEIRPEELEEIITNFETTINKYDDNEKIVLFSETVSKTVKEIIPASDVFLLFLRENTIFEVVLEESSSEHRKEMDISNKIGIISDVYYKKESAYFNQIENIEKYDENIDNVSDTALKNLLLVPILDEEKSVVAIIWAGTHKGNLNQYVKGDLEYMNRFSKVLTTLFSDENILSSWQKSLAKGGVWSKVQSWFK
ncbi:MAG: GAF domain-containing protein [Bacteroidales bacterium]|nr:GAF domain-containing protein [Bacteroidales bacterium]